MDLGESLGVAIEIALAAGKIIKDTCGQVKSVETKQSFADLVTETDQNVEEYVFNQLKRKFPEDKFIGEESASSDPRGGAATTLTDDRTWIVDPVDAIKRQPVLGVVFCPGLDQLFTASKGRGAHCNGRPIRVRQSSSLRESLVCAEIGSDRSDEKRKCVFDNLQSVSWQCHGIRSLGSAAMNICSVATGQTNAFYEFGLHCWDMCAPVAILLEAGGFACDTSGIERPLDLMARRLLVASSKHLAESLGQALGNQLELTRDDE